MRARGPVTDATRQGPLIPLQLGLDDHFQFRCHKGISCFNVCCRSIDITLTPYDIVRLKNRLGLASYEFLVKHAQRFDMDAHGMPGLKLNPKPGTSECQFLTDEGCSVYEDRPTACRYYALGSASMRKAGAAMEEDFYFVVKESHCRGHEEEAVQTVRDYREDQGVDLYDALNREWRQLVLKKRSCGPTIGRPSARSLDLFYLCSYDVDGLREFVKSPGFSEVFAIEPGLIDTLLKDETELMKFGFRILRQVLFGEQTIALRKDAAAKRVARRRAASDRAMPEQPASQ